jgi:hypothetical protein
MADDIPFANGRGPAPRRQRMYASPFGSLQNDAGDIQYGNGTGPLPRPRMFAAPFGALQTDSPLIQYGNGSTGPSPREPTNALAQERPPASPFGIAPPGTIPPPPPNVITQPPPESSSPPPNVPAGSVLTPFGWVSPDDINALARVFRRRF